MCDILSLFSLTLHLTLPLTHEAQIPDLEDPPTKPIPPPDVPRGLARLVQDPIRPNPNLLHQILS